MVGIKFNGEFMKKKSAIIIGILILALVALVCVIVFGPKPEETNKKVDILALSNRSDLEKYVSENSIMSYSFDDNIAYVRDVELFGAAADIEFLMTEEIFDKISVGYVLFQPSAEVYENDTDVPDEVPIYQFNDEDKEDINKAFNIVKAEFEGYIGCSFEDYDIVPTADSENLEKNEENFFAGKYIKEYSVRDGNGILWIMQFEASYGSSSVVIHKLVNETGYEGFIPGIDLTKK